MKLFTLVSRPIVNFDICEISEYEKDWTFLKKFKSQA